MKKRVAIESADSYRIETIKRTLEQCFEDYGLPKNNPLGEYIKPGNRVFIKPNWVASRWRESCPHKDSLYCVITHPNVIEAVADYVAEALNGEGEIIIGDNPSIDADFNELCDFTGIKRLKNKYNVKTSIVDLRPLVCDDLKNYGKKDLMVHQSGDKNGEIECNLGKDSLLYGLDPSRFRGVFDEREDTINAHSGEKQLYTFAKSLYDADVYISIPKMKTHQKVGATLNLKGLVGAITNKNQLVHWQIGYPEICGDEYPSKEAWLDGENAKVKHRGAWPGNDTIWRMVADLYELMIRKNRVYLSVVDGIVAGEGQGPFCNTSKNANTLVFGDDLIAVDCATVRYMGIEPTKLKYLNHFIKNNYISIDNIEVFRDGNYDDNFFVSDSMYKDFLVVQSWSNVKHNVKEDTHES